MVLKQKRQKRLRKLKSKQMANSPVMTVEVLRYNPENDQEPHLSSYQVPYDNQTSLLDALGYIKDKLEPSK